MSHRTIYRVSGLIWAIIGFLLLKLGINFVMQGWQGTYFSASVYSSFFLVFSSWFGSYENASIAVIILGIVIGTFKGRLIMQKAAIATQARVSKLENPTSLKNIYTIKNLVIIGFMMTLGKIMNFLEVRPDIRGLVDIAVGTALLQGAVQYFRLNDIICGTESPSSSQENEKLAPQEQDVPSDG